MSELKYWVWFAQKQSIKIRSKLAILKYFGTPENVYFAEQDDYKDLILNGIVFADDVKDLMRKNLVEARQLLRSCDESGVDILTVADAAYPTRLKNIYDPPLVIYVKGKLPTIDEEAAIAIVGTRRATDYGLLTAERIGYEIARVGGLVVSGLAEGIDSAAARGALRGGGKVIGVLGCGVDVVYPAFNWRLYEDVKTVGALVSEYPPGTRPSRSAFPARNRIMSGLSVAVAVVEAPARSGALITASLAMDQGRDVYAVPANVDAVTCQGSNALLREGALVALSGEDIIAPYIYMFPDRLDSKGGRELAKLSDAGAANLIERTKNGQNKPEKSEKTEKPEKAENVSAASQDMTKKAVDNSEDEDYILISSLELTEEQAKIVSILDRQLHIDQIIEKSGLSAQQVMSALTELTIEGAVSQETGKFFTPRFKLDG